MAERRMFTKKVTDDDHFHELSASAQALYLHLTMSADDDGFCNQVSVSMFKAHASVQDLEALLEKRYLLQFESGVIVIKHWRMANALRNDRYKPTAFQEELAKLKIKENGSYTIGDDGCQLVANRLPDGCHSIEEDSIEEDSIEEDITTSDEVVCRTKDVRRIVEAWNSLNLQQLTKVTADSIRGKMLKARIKDYGVDGVLNAIEHVRKSEFLNGNNSKGWIISFEWFVKPNNFTKVLEGNYDSLQKESQTKKPGKYVTAAEYVPPKATQSVDDLWKAIEKI